MASPRPVPDRRARLRATLAAAAAAGAALLLASTFMTVIGITVDGSSRLPSADTHLSGWDRHGPALVVLALAALGLALGAARGARACMAALAACGVAALAIVLVGDLPDIDETGFIGQIYADAEAGPSFGWYAETAGAVLLLLAGVVLLLLTPAPERPAAPVDRAARAAADREQARRRRLKRRAAAEKG
jgi:hypothetical protein